MANNKTTKLKVGDRVLACNIGTEKVVPALIEEIQTHQANKPKRQLGEPLYWIRFLESKRLGARWECELTRVHK